MEVLVANHMVTLTVENLPDELYRRLEEQARRHGRSVSKEAARLIEAGLMQPPPPRRRVLAPIRLASGHRPTISEIERAIAEGQS